MSDISKIVEFILQKHRDAARRGHLPAWKVEEPEDFPGCYVARLFEVAGSEVPQPTEVMLRAVGPNDGLKTLRDAFGAAGLHCKPRCATDRTEIVETWV